MMTNQDFVKLCKKTVAEYTNKHLDKTDGKQISEDDVYIVEAEWLIRILCRTDLDDYESLQYFQRVLISSGIIDALREKGIQEGDIVSIYDFEFEFMN